MSTPSRRNVKRKETAENSNNKRRARAHIPEEPYQINRETSDVTDVTEGNIIFYFFKKKHFISNILIIEMQERMQEETLNILEGCGNLTIDKLIMQNSELIKKLNIVNNKIENIEKLISEFIENKKEEISEVFVAVILNYETFRLTIII